MLRRLVTPLDASGMVTRGHHWSTGALIRTGVFLTACPLRATPIVTKRTWPRCFDHLARQRPFSSTTGVRRWRAAGPGSLLDRGQAVRDIYPIIADHSSSEARPRWFVLKSVLWRHTALARRLASCAAFLRRGKSGADAAVTPSSRRSCGVVLPLRRPTDIAKRQRQVPIVAPSVSFLRFVCRGPRMLRCAQPGLIALSLYCLVDGDHAHAFAAGHRDKKPANRSLPMLRVQITSTRSLGSTKPATPSTFVGRRWIRPSSPGNRGGQLGR